MKHFWDKANCRRFVGIFLGELYRQLERAVLEGRIVRPENHSIPNHNIVISRRARDTCGWIFLESTERTKIWDHCQKRSSWRCLHPGISWPTWLATLSIKLCFNPRIEVNETGDERALHYIANSWWAQIIHSACELTLWNSWLIDSLIFGFAQIIFQE